MITIKNIQQERQGDRCWHVQNIAAITDGRVITLLHWRSNKTDEKDDVAGRLP